VNAGRGSVLPQRSGNIVPIYVHLALFLAVDTLQILLSLAAIRLAYNVELGALEVLSRKNEVVSAE
jgi:hypothetical protein